MPKGKQWVEAGHAGGYHSRCRISRKISANYLARIQAMRRSSSESVAKLSSSIEGSAAKKGQIAWQKSGQISMQLTITRCRSGLTNVRWDTHSPNPHFSTVPPNWY